MRALQIALCLLLGTAVPLRSQQEPLPKAPTDVKPGSITYEEIAYPYPVAYLPLTLYGQDVRMAYMDVPPAGAAQRPHGRPVSRHELRRLLFRRPHRGASQRRLPRRRARSDRFRPIVEADHSV